MKFKFLIVLILFGLNIKAQSSEDLYKKGIQYYKENDVQNSLKAFEQSFNIKPDFKSYGMYVLISLANEQFDGLYENNKIIPIQSNYIR